MCWNINRRAWIADITVECKESLVNENNDVVIVDALEKISARSTRRKKSYIRQNQVFRYRDALYTGNKNTAVITSNVGELPVLTVTVVDIYSIFGCISAV